MPFKSEMYLDVRVITGGLFGFFGSLLLFWKAKPVHCRLYWGQLCHKTMQYKYWMTELTSDTPGPDTFVVGKGDVYTIQVSLAEAPVGVRMDDFDTSKVSTLASDYASTKNGDLTSAQSSDRIWCSEPQGYGGPMYGIKHTSNTYAWWVLSKAAMNKGAMPAAPAGSLGWACPPMFPMPPKCDNA